MNTQGAIFMTLSLIFVWGLVIWCFAKVLRAPKD